VAVELVLGVERVAAEMLERGHVPENVVLGADFADRAKLEAGWGFDAGEVIVLPF
jgi:hypothetical protein